MTAADQLKPGTKIGGYRIIERLGRGASASVYLCHNKQGEAFAVKVRRRGITAADRRFVREFEALRSLRLPGVVRVFEAGLESTLIWYSMEVVRGHTLLEYIHLQKSIEQRIALTLSTGKQLMDILARLHHAGFVHRDIKPSNVLVDQNGELKVLDFGISQYFAPIQDYTDPGMVVGTVPYMAPEQFAGLPSSDRLDVFAAGLMLHEAVHGKRPSPKSPLGWIPLITLDKPVPLAILHPQVPRRLSSILDDMVHAIPSKRPTAEVVAKQLETVVIGQDEGPWPTPVWTDVGTWWLDLERLYHSKTVQIGFLEGPHGSGKRRIAEQLHRNGLLQNVWTLHSRCQLATVGAPIIALLQQVIRDGEDEEWNQAVLGTDAHLLSTLWPDLPISTTLNSTEEDQPTVEDIAAAVGRTLQRASTQRRIVWVLEQFEFIDALTAATIYWISKERPQSLGVLLLHDDRWSGVFSKQLAHALSGLPFAISLRTPPMKPHIANQLARTICTSSGEAHSDALGSVQASLNHGYQALAKWRGEKWEAPPVRLWPFALASTGLPEHLITTLCGELKEIQHWIQQDEHGDYVLKNQFVLQTVKARLGGIKRTARIMVDAWESAPIEARHLSALPRLYILCGEDAKAWPRALECALRCHQTGRYAAARQWLVLLETLPFPQTFSQEKAFELTITRAQVALITETHTPRQTLLNHCERLATTSLQIQSVGILLAQHQMRRGDIRSGLVTALRCASPSVGPDPWAAVAALCVATQCRLLLHQPIDARTQVERAKTILIQHPKPDLKRSVLLLDAQICLEENRYEEALTLAQRARTLVDSEENIWSEATAKTITGAVFRILGERQHAEEEVRFARLELGISGDMTQLTQAYLQLAQLLVERGDIIGARKYFNRSLRRINRIGIPQAEPLAMHVQLDVSTAMSQFDEAEAAIQYFSTRAQTPEGVQASIVRYWRARGNRDKAMMVDAPLSKGWGFILWRLERAMTSICASDLNTAKMELHSVSTVPELPTYKDLYLYFQLLHEYTQNQRWENWNRRVATATHTLYLPLIMAALELSARRMANEGRAQAAHTLWETLHARSEELGYRPGVELARQHLDY